ncbi:NAD(P)H-dependent oxidoreductase subunit E [Pseudoflavonifractor sp. 524-17]|uniref:NADH-quinone oxidoreductase subunit NuoE family protein n=1 Tax=Pseudoflavonifractor sp. 524-17 TaxID=2304577 RepID=UPI0013794835|nr:NAD(P)H-dependent oxidoreductase subunit E [Pseudoflavonifractor sp. 524-17]NCE63764.1 NAD(P)H-dependent oxidoreductase subunit E [Pseudoflavonifractor sp. 524-17]
MKPFAKKLTELTPEMVSLVDEIIASHDGDATQLVGILLDLEAAVERHYIPEPAAYYLAERLEIRPTQVYDVISFYSALHDKPRAKYTLQVCDSAPCRVKDSDTLCETLQRLLNLEVGEVTYDGRFSIEKVPCFGACDVSPAVRVNGVVYGHLDSEERIVNMLQQLD